MRLDHLLSKEGRSRVCITVYLPERQRLQAAGSRSAGRKKSGGDAPGGNTRTHAEHESEGPGGRWYYAGDGMEEQEAARLLKKTTERFLYRILVFTSD